MKTGENRAEYSICEIIEILKRYDDKGKTDEIEQILTRGEAVRFSPVSSQNLLRLRSALCPFGSSR